MTPPPEKFGLPLQSFLYTLDQIQSLFEISVDGKSPYIHWDNRSVGIPSKDRMLARNIAPSGEKPDWRVADREVVRWLRRKRFRIYERGWVTK